MDISLYFHIPFCTKKCPYCHFYSITNRSELHSTFLNALKLEWEEKLPTIQNHRIISIYFGGGTPSLFNVSPILSWIHSSSINIAADCEITIEANPEKLDLTLLKDLRQSGINRISIGVQSLDDPSLQILGRAHSAKKAIDAINDAYCSNFKNISIDLMYDIPHQNKTSWISTLNQLNQLPITHLSLYNLTIEPRTPFYSKKEIIEQSMPKSELSLELLEIATERLELLGLHRYEISAFAKLNYPSIHNSGYWTGRPFLGFGPSAFSYWNGERFKNISHLHQYAKLLIDRKDIVEFREKLPYPANINELLAIRLRLLDGADLTEWSLPDETLDHLQSQKTEGFLEQDGPRWKLTNRGILFYDTVAENLISDESIL